MTARLPETVQEAETMQAFADQWTKELGPDSGAQEALIRASAAAAARLERCRKIEEATMRQAALDAVARWERKKRHQVRARAQELAKDPFNTVADLECSSFGCEWLTRHWQSLDAILAQGVTLERAEIDRIMKLFGFVPIAPGPGADPFMIQLWNLAHLAAGFPVPKGSGLPNDLASARHEMREIIAAEVDRLDRVRAELWDSIDGPEAEAVAHRGLEDTTREGQLRKRYAREAFSEMTRGLNLVMRVRVENGKFADRLWWQAHPHVKKPRGVTPFHHPESMPTCLIPDPRPAPAPEPLDDPPSSRNEPQTGTEKMPTEQPNLNPEHEIRNRPSAEAPGGAERSQPEFEPGSAAPAPSVSPVSSPLEAPVWPSETPMRA